MPLPPTTLQGKLASDLNNIFKDAYIKAKETTIPSGGEPADVVAFANQKMTEAVEKEAKEFADEISEKLATTITDYIKSATIMCTITTPLTVATPMGPGTAMGPINPSDFKIEFIP